MNSKITTDKFKYALMEYVSHELCSKLHDYRKWVVPVFVGMYMPKVDEMIEMNKPLLVSVGAMDESGLICLEGLYSNFREAARKQGNIIQPVPMIGDVTFTADDIDKLYRFLSE